MFSVPLLLSIKLHTSIYLALFHVCLGVNMWNKEHLSSDFYLLKTILQFKIKPWCTNEQCWILFFSGLSLWRKFSTCMSIIADNTNGYTSVFSLLFFAQILSSAFFWISVKIHNVTVFVVCFLSCGWHWMMTSEMYTYAVIHKCFFLFRNEENNANNR